MFLLPFGRSEDEPRGDRDGEPSGEISARARFFDGRRHGFFAFREEVLGQHPHLRDFVVEIGAARICWHVYVAVVLITAGDAHFLRIDLHAAYFGTLTFLIGGTFFVHKHTLTVRVHDV